MNTLRRFFQAHRRLTALILAGALPIVDVFCPQIEVANGRLWFRSFFKVTFIYLA